MKNVIQKLSIGALLALAASAASAEVTVNYIQPDNFSDVTTGGEREQVLRDLVAHFVKLGEKLPAGTNLRVDVQDIDMAGTERAARAGEVRSVMRGDWPRIDLQYVLEKNGQVVSSGPAQLRDTSFLDRPNRYFPHDQLRYEKRMIDMWFESTIIPASR